MIGKDIFQNENGILFGFSHLHYSLVLILSMVGIYLMIIQTMPGVLTFIGGSLFFPQSRGQQILYFAIWNGRTHIQKNRRKQNIIKTVKEKIYEKQRS